MTTKKTNLLLLSSLILIGVVFSISNQEIVFAKSPNSEKNPLVTTRAISPTSTVIPTQTAVPTGATTEAKKQPQNNNGQKTAEAHRSMVATYVKELLSVADRNTGIGESVRVIAQQQNDSKDEVAQKIDAVENRSEIKTFLIGSDYKNLNGLKSDMAVTNNQLDQLKNIVGKTTNTEDKTILQNQISLLEQEQAKINSFITQNENKFSLFGWIAKFFNK